MNWLSLLGLEQWAARMRVAAIEGAIAAEDRMELALLEWQEQKRRLFQMMVLAVIAIGLTVVSLVMVSMAVLVHFWDTPHRATTGWLIAALWLVGWIVALATLMRTAKDAGQGFALTRQELAHDWRAIKERL